MGSPFANELLLVLLGAIAAFFVSFGAKRGSTRQVVILSILFSLSLFVIDRIVWLQTKRNLVDHTTCLVAPGGRACAEEREVSTKVEPLGNSAGAAANRTASPSPRVEAATAPRSNIPYHWITFQLGAFPSDAQAREKWRRLQDRFPFLPRGEATVTPVHWPGSRVVRTLFRLRAPLMPRKDAESICQRLRVNGESCVVVD